MRTSIERGGNGKEAVLRLEGELDMDSHDTLRDSLEQLTQDSPERLVVDLSDVPFVDSVGVLLLMGLEMTARQKESRVVIRGARPRVRKVFRLVGLEWVIDDEGEARPLDQA